MSRLLQIVLCGALLLIPTRAMAAPGILLLAHGGSTTWNDQVLALAADVNRTIPTEVAFGMATRSSLQSGVDRLVARGVSDVTVVPLFVSSWSSIITSTEYLLGLRPDAPADLAMFARMTHGAPSAGAAPTGHEGHVMSDEGTTPIVKSVPIRMTAALNDHPIVADIIASRARAISQRPSNETVILVAHGPNDDEDNRRWLVDMASLATQLRSTSPFAAIEYVTLRDDAEPAVRDQATAALRALVERHAREGRQVLIVPLLVSYGGIDRGLRERLNGLSYAMPSAALVPDARLVTWVLTMAGVPTEARNNR
ncbi:MAG: CbiX/SirB N-terminal domain-containing protein [Vicinamibacterales bacterium]